MKTIPRLVLLCGTLALAGCASPQGGTVDETEYNYGRYNEGYNPNVPGRPDDMHRYPSQSFPDSSYPLLPNGTRW
jgi:hypothetical protein